MCGELSSHIIDNVVLTVEIGEVVFPILMAVIIYKTIKKTVKQWKDRESIST